MLINKITYELQLKNYVQVSTDKKLIILGNSFTENMLHYKRWLHRLNGQYKKTAHFTIGLDGKVTQHIDTKFYTEVFNDVRINKKSIHIILENEGWLLLDEQKKIFINWIGDIYNRTEKVTMKRWRGQLYWAPYPQLQIKAVTELVKTLCLKHNIPQIALSNNTKRDDVVSFEGVLYRSSVSKDFTDISPAFDCEAFSEMIKTL